MKRMIGIITKLHGPSSNCVSSLWLDKSVIKTCEPPSRWEFQRPTGIIGVKTWFIERNRLWLVCRIVSDFQTGGWLRNYWQGECTWRYLTCCGALFSQTMRAKVDDRQRRYLSIQSDADSKTQQEHCLILFEQSTGGWSRGSHATPLARLRSTLLV